jgi:hypothetical protein
MNRKVYCSIIAVIFMIGLTSCSSSSKKTPPPPVVAIAATSGTPQSATIGTAFAAPLVATVTTGGTPTANVSVTFTAPASGASGTFATATPGATDTEVTNASGVATSQVFTANTTAGAYTVTASATGATSASYSLTNTAGAAANLTATGGTPQNVATGATAAALVAQVTDSGGNGVAGISVTFTAPAADPSGTFTSTGTNTETDMTDANGNATAADFVAGAVGGPYNVVATSGTLTAVNFVLTNTVVTVSTNYVFYLSGQELINTGPNFVVLAGAVTIDQTGTVLGGEQDYNDALGITSPEPSGDAITGGTLTVDGTTGQGTLTLITDNANVGVAGTETLAVQFVNTNHALISQFDGTATSSGSMDAQATSTPSGNFAYTLSGVDKAYLPTAFGGVFTIAGTAVAGVTDQNDSGTVTLNQPFAGTLSAADALGRGTLTITGSSSLINYYIVGPEVLRIIDVDIDKANVGSAFGQGVGTFNNASLGTSVLAMANNPFSSHNGEGGQFCTSNTSTDRADFAGVGEGNELANGVASTLASAITGTYTIAITGYGSLTVGNGGLADAVSEGIYMTDPTLNLSDPNNTVSGGGGALVLSLDAVLAGTTGVLVPQTDATAASFAGNYLAGIQDFNDFSTCALCEFDVVAQGTVTAGVLSLTGDVSDPFLTLGVGGTGLYTGSTFTSTPLADATNTGRYSMLQTNATPNPLAATINGVSGVFDVTLYQASGTQLFWLEFDSNAVWVGPVEQLGSLAGLPAARKAPAKTKTKQKR